METAPAATLEWGKSRSEEMPAQTVFQRSRVRRVERMRSKATILSTADSARTEMWQPAADCWRSWRRAEDSRRSTWI
ncbi:hypothetical protein RHMOL_Rhmol05G0062700 [Rhododendron molle]|uniref:Uncharacterized protein n=1 Tax=Rhododendron molle TaxID=49168 RepID=A0ACC0NKV5_RHOML|nr:hypothetical protein RHMOL_Rhmol05G0062700 [Rhododendron molle]